MAIDRPEPKKPKRLYPRDTSLKDKIKQAEEQLANAAVIPMPTLNHDKNAPSDRVMIERDRKMPAPGTRDAPKFTSEKPEGLR